MDINVRSFGGEIDGINLVNCEGSAPAGQTGFDPNCGADHTPAGTEHGRREPG